MEMSATGWHGRSVSETMLTLLEKRAAESPDRVYLVIEGSDPITYAEADARSRELAVGLLELGVEPGDKVATLLDTRAETVFLWFACARIGAVFMPLNTALRGTFLEHQLRQASARVLFTECTRLADVDPVLEPLGPQIKGLVVLDGESGSQGGQTRRLPYPDLVENGRRNPRELPAPARWTDPAMILFTSGTTGASKGVVLSHNFVVFMADLYKRSLEIGPDDVFFSGLPLFHLSGSVITVLSPLVSGARAAVDKGFSVSRFWRRVREVGATHTLLMGGMSEMLWNRPPDEDEVDNPMRALVACPISEALHRPFEERFGVVVLTSYGLSEAGQMIFSSVAQPSPPGTSGRPVDQYEVVIVDDDDCPVPAGQSGEILVRPREPHLLFEGYIGDAEATQKVLRNQWLHTGDIGSIDADGWFRFVDRKKDYLRRRGENISSFEAEQALLACPDVAEAAVIGVPSELSEDEVKACVVLQPGSSLSEEDLLKHCIRSMPYFAVPRFIQFLPELPRNPTGRIQKFVLRERHAAESGWDRDVAGITVTRTSAAELRASELELTN